jgi:hypothetical protein
MKTLPFVPYYKTHLHYTAKLHKKQGIILVWSPNWDWSLAKRTEFALTPRGRNTRRIARRARERSLWDNSAAQLFNTLYRLSPANKSADKHHLAGIEISPFTKQNHSQNDCGLHKIQQLNIETEQNNIAVLHHILLALGAN